MRLIPFLFLISCFPPKAEDKPDEVEEFRDAAHEIICSELVDCGIIVEGRYYECLQDIEVWILGEELDPTGCVFNEEKAETCLDEAENGGLQCNENGTFDIPLSCYMVFRSPVLGECAMIENLKERYQ